MSGNRLPGLKDWIYSSILIFSFIIILIISSKEFYPADYNEWHKDWGAFINYIYSSSPIPFTGLSKFTLAYLFNSFLSDQNARNLAWVNSIFLFIPILCLALIHGWRLALSAGSVFISALIFSPIPVYYLYSGALEVQSGVLIGIFMSTLAMLMFSDKKEQPKSLLLLLSLSGFVLPTYKDTVVIVIVFGFLFLVFINLFIQSFFKFPGPTRESIITVIKYGALPTLLGIILSASYNMAKYGVYLPVVYLIESRETSPDIYKSVEFFIGSIFSPNGGIIVFWFLSLFIMIGGWRMLGFSPRKSVVSLGVTCVMLTLLGLAKWWAPFGWDSWGNRLAIPSIFGLMVGMLLSLEPLQSKGTFTNKFFNKLKPYKLILICPVAVVCIYYLSVPYLSTSFSNAMQASLNPGPACQNMYRALQNEASNMGLEFWKSDIYYNCVRERMLHFPRPK
jgi:hypothetical protein